MKRKIKKIFLILLLLVVLLLAVVAVLTFTQSKYSPIKVSYASERMIKRSAEYKNTLTQQFEESHRLETEIMKQLDSLGFNNVTR